MCPIIEVKYVCLGGTALRDIDIAVSRLQGGEGAFPSGAVEDGKALVLRDHLVALGGCEVREGVGKRQGSGARAAKPVQA